MFRYKSLLALAVAATATMALTTVGRADVFQLTVDNCTGGCNPGAPGTSMGTVTVTQFATNQVQISVALVAPLEFINTGLQQTIDFNITGTPTIALVSTSNSNFSLTSTTAGSQHFDGFGNFEYAMQLNTAQGAGGAQPSPETFVISSAGLTVAQLETSGTGASAFFGVDVFNPTRNTTGPIGTGGGPGGSVPLPGAAVLFGSVLFGGLGLSKWRKGRQRGPVSLMA